MTLGGLNENPFPAKANVRLLVAPAPARLDVARRDNWVVDMPAPLFREELESCENGEYEPVDRVRQQLGGL
ncbi:hypothetical protein N7453_007693 [Penicillium expansum]|nr:hypothetical protein N7453_007693 [Penicillium expansum]